MRIVFMGTPDFAVASLAALVEQGFNVVGVVTAPDRPAGRGLQLRPSAVKTYALEQGLPLLQPEKLRDPAFQTALRAWQADLQVVVAFRMLPESVWNMPPLGTINVHGSLLPNYRGAAPINWAVINGETETGVTTFKLQHAIDTGDILLQASMPIGPNETATSVHDRMKVLGAKVLVQTLQGLMDNSLTAKPQQLDQPVQHAPKIFSADCVLDFHQPMAQVFNRVRGLAEFPGASTQLEGKTLKVFRANKAQAQPQDFTAVGDWWTDGATILQYRCADGWLQIEELQLEGKKRMTTEAFLRGWKPATKKD